MREKTLSLDNGGGKFWGYDCTTCPRSHLLQIGAGGWRDFTVYLGRKKRREGEDYYQIMYLIMKIIENLECRRINNRAV